MRKEQDIKFGRRAFFESTLLAAGGLVLASCNYPSGEGKSGNLNFPKGEEGSEATQEIPEPSAEPSLSPSESPTEAPFTYFDKYVYPALSDMAQKTRLEKAEKDPDYWHRVDKELNESRVNFVFLGIGSEGLLTDSIQLMSLKRGENEVRSVTIHRDTEAPEISRFKGNDSAYRINQAHILGGMPLVEEVLEDATGLSADYVVVLDMGVLPRAVEKVFANHLEVCIPWEIDDTMMGYFPSGVQTLNGEEVLRVSRARYYGSNADRNTIQQYVLRAIVRRARVELSGNMISAADFIRRGYIFYEKETEAGNIKSNFDKTLFLEISKNLVEQIVKGGEEGKAEGFGLPDISGRYHIKSEVAGGGRKKPLGGNPDSADLVTGYWLAAREEVRDFLIQPIAEGFEKELEVCGIQE